MPKHPRDAYITIFGRKPVLEALQTEELNVDKLWIDARARGPTIDAILERASELGLEPRRVDAREVTRLSRNKKQDQGVVLDVLAPRMDALSRYLGRVDRPDRETMVLLDGLTTPGNVGIAIRSITAAGLTAIVLPRAGSPEVGPLVVKASAGIAFRAPLLRAPTSIEAAQGLRAAGFVLVGLAADAEEAIYSAALPERIAVVVGNETRGITPEVEELLDRRWSIPLAAGIESINAAAAASVVSFELARRGRGSA